MMLKRNSLIWRISISFFLILSLLGLSYVLITLYAANRYYQETTQRLNAHVAEHMLVEVSPFVDGEVNEEALGVIMHSMMAVNPSIEVYLLGLDGEILSYVVLDKKVKLSRVELKPVLDFIESGGKDFILGDDPRNPGKQTIFSATAVKEKENLLGYVYIVLVSEDHEQVNAALINSYWFKIGSRSFLLTFGAALLIGFILIWLLAKSLNRVVITMQRFEAGDLVARIPEEHMTGELKLLSRNFNQMADTILHNIEQLKKVDNLRRELIANISHDLRNPLAVIHGYIETLMIKKGKISETDNQKYLQIISDNSNKLNQLVGALFELSKLDSGQIELHKEPIFINELVLESLESFKLMAENKKISIETDVSTSLPRIEADMALMERVIQNLISNAIKFTPDHGKIKINLYPEGNEIKFDIKNSGPGIPPEDLPNIFDRYYKVHREHNGSDGTGLGLAIVKKILDLHELNIQVQSIANKETVFTITIPV